MEERKRKPLAVIEAVKLYRLAEADYPRSGLAEDAKALEPFANLDSSLPLKSSPARPPVIEQHAVGREEIPLRL